MWDTCVINVINQIGPRTPAVGGWFIPPISGAYVWSFSLCSVFPIFTCPTFLLFINNQYPHCVCCQASYHQYLGLFCGFPGCSPVSNTKARLAAGVVNANPQRDFGLYHTPAKECMWIWIWAVADISTLSKPSRGFKAILAKTREIVT